MHPVRKIVNSNVFIICILFVLICILFYEPDREPIPTYLEVTTGIYKLSWECIRDNYYHELTGKGIVVSTDKSPICENDGDIEFLDEYVTIIDNFEEDFINEMANDLGDYVTNINANATFFICAKLKRVDNDDLLKDISEDFRNYYQNKFDYFFPEIEEPDEPDEIPYPPPVEPRKIKPPFGKSRTYTV